MWRHSVLRVTLFTKHQVHITPLRSYHVNVSPLLDHLATQKSDIFRRRCSIVILLQFRYPMVTLSGRRTGWSAERATGCDALWTAAPFPPPLPRPVHAIRPGPAPRQSCAAQHPDSNTALLSRLSDIPTGAQHCCPVESGTPTWMHLCFPARPGTLTGSQEHSAAVRAGAQRLGPAP